VTESEVIKCCEDKGYWKKGTSIDTLYEMGVISTPWAMYKLGERKEDKK
jgi:hypothetical protein